MESRLSGTFLLLLVLLAVATTATLAQKPGNFGEEDLSEAKNKTCAGPDCQQPSPDAPDQSGSKQSKYKQKLQNSLQSGKYQSKKSSKSVKKDRLGDEDSSSNSTLLWSESELGNSSRIVPKKEADSGNDTYAYEGKSVVPKKGVLEFDNSSVVPKKGVEGIFTDGGTVVPKKGVSTYDNSTVVPKKGVDGVFNSDDSPVIPKKGVSSASQVLPRKGAVDDAHGDHPTYVSGRKGVPSDSDSGQINSTTNEQNLNRSNSSGLHSAEVPHSKEVVPEIDKVDPTPNTSLLVGLVFGLLLLAVLGFLVFKRVDAVRRRREYRRMNDFLIDGMYNDL